MPTTTPQQAKECNAAVALEASNANDKFSSEANADDKSGGEVDANGQASTDNLYKLEGRVPLGKALFFGLQNVLAVFIGNLTPILMVAAVAKCGGVPFTIDDTANLVQATMFAAGLATLMQLFPVWKIGSHLPIVMGTSFTFVGACMTIASQDYSMLVGAIIVSGAVEGFLGLGVNWWRRFITPVISGCVILTVGLGLVGVGMNYCAGGQAPNAGHWTHLSVALITLTSSIVAQVCFKGIWRQLNLLFGIIIGYMSSLVITLAGYDTLLDMGAIQQGLSQHSLISIPQLFPYAPQFDLFSIISLTIICLTSAMQTIGATEAICNGVLKRPTTNKELGGAVCCDGFANSVVGWLLGCLPVTTYEQNIGVLALSKATNIYVVAAGAGIMIAAGMFPSLGVLLANMPASVLGGSLIMVFGSICYISIEMISNSGFTRRNSLICSLAIGIGLGLHNAPQAVAGLPQHIGDLLVKNPVIMVFIVAIVLSIILPRDIKD